MWGTRGWQLVLSATSSFPVWTQCERYEAALRAEEERIAAEEERLAAIQQLSHTPAPRRGQKRQAVDNLEHLNVQYQTEALLHNFSQLDVSKVPMLQGLPAPQQEQLITGFTPSLHTAMRFISPADQMILPAIQLRPLRPLLITFLPLTPSAVALDFHFLYPIQVLCH